MPQGNNSNSVSPPSLQRTITPRRQAQAEALRRAPAAQVWRRGLDYHLALGLDAGHAGLAKSNAQKNGQNVRNANV